MDIDLINMAKAKIMKDIIPPWKSAAKFDMVKSKYTGMYGPCVTTLHTLYVWEKRNGCVYA